MYYKVNIKVEFLTCSEVYEMIVVQFLSLNRKSSIFNNIKIYKQIHCCSINKNDYFYFITQRLWWE